MTKSAQVTPDAVDASVPQSTAPALPRARNPTDAVPRIPRTGKGTLAQGIAWLRQRSWLTALEAWIRRPRPATAPGVGEWSTEPVGGEQHSGVFRVSDDAWYALLAKSGAAVVAVAHPEWRGVRSSTENLFEHRLFIERLTASQARHLLGRLRDAGCRQVVLQGWPPGCAPLVDEIHRFAPGLKLKVIWHGSLMQLGEQAEWAALQRVIAGFHAGQITRIGFVKHGMADVFAHLGIDSAFVMNYVRTIPTGPSTPRPAGPHIGLWAVAPIWRKLPYTMLAAAALVPGAQVWMTGHNQRTTQVANLLGVRHQRLAEGALPRSEMPTALAQMDVNLYVTLSECAPMLPLESLAVGVPCLLGPTSHYFRDHPELHRRLVVSYPDDPLSVAEVLQAALAHRTEIVSAYAAYARGYNAAARASVDAFLLQ